MTWRASFRAALSAARFCMSSAALRPRLQSGHRASGCNLVDERRIVIAGARLVDAPRYRPHAMTILGGWPEELRARLAIQPGPDIRVVEYHRHSVVNRARQRARICDNDRA